MKEKKDIYRREPVVVVVEKDVVVKDLTTQFIKMPITR